MTRPNVLWVTLESTRADHCSLYGYERETTPALTALAAESDARAFADCHTHGIWTRSSSASILTGTYPTHHRVGLDTEVRLPDRIETVPERFGAAGYATACLSPNPNLSSSSGLDRGFDRFNYLSMSTLLRECPLSSLLKYAANVRRHAGGFTRETGKHPFGYLVTELAERRVDEFAGGGEPYFLYVHYPDTHHPYYPPKPYRDRFAGDLPMSGDEAAELAFDLYEEFQEHIAAGCPFSGEEWAAVEAMYDTMIRYTDDLVDRLVAHARDRSERPTVVVVTADHGELLGERGLLTHRFVADSALSHVPLVVAGDGVGLEFRESPVVQHSDVVRTLLAAAGADADGIQGYDLTEQSREFAFTQRGGERATGMLSSLSDRAPGFDPDRFPRGDLTSVTDGGYRYEETDDGEWTALYPLPEGGSLPRPAGSEADRLADALAAFRADWGRPVTDEVQAGELTDGMEDHLEDLGYI